VFTDLLLADEINRAPAKTQAALLEAMGERQVTADGDTRALGELFTTFATQNPVEYEGTYPLPEAQLDRFLIKIAVPYPSLEAELQMLDLYGSGFDAERSRVAVGGHLSLAHGLEQGGLRFCRRTIDLIGKQKVGEHRARLKFEAVRRVTDDADPCDVGRHQIGSELDASEPHAECTGQCANEDRLRCSRNAFEKCVTSRQKGHQCLLDNRLLTDHAH